MRKKSFLKLFCVLAAAMILFICCGGKEEKEAEKIQSEIAPSREIAKVRGHILNLEDFKKYLKYETYGNETLKLDDEALSFYLESFLEQKALYFEAIEKKITASESEIRQKILEMKQTLSGDKSDEEKTVKLFSNKDWIEYFRESQTVNRYVEMSVTADVAISQNEEKEYYRKLYGSQKPQKRYNLSQISLNNKNIALQIKKELDKNKNVFEALAKQYSKTPEGAKGGYIGWYTAQQLPEYLESVVVKMQPGQISDIITMEYGYVILRLDGSEIQYAPTFQEAQEFVRYKLLQEKRENYLADYLKNIWLEKKSDRTGILIFIENLDFNFTPAKK